MKLCRILTKFFIIAIIFLPACKTDRKNNQETVDYDSINLDKPENVLASFDTTGEGLPIFYNMYLSVDMSSMFKTAGAVFDNDLLSKPDKSTDYITSSKKSLNLGVYAVDLSYCRVFEQFEMAGRYFNSMQKLSEELGIPSEHFVNTAKRFDRNITDKDSLITIANEVYSTTDKYLKDNEQYSSAAQIIMGGWVEAMHIAFNIAESSKDIDIIERIAEQKHSLANLLEMLSGYKENESVKEYLKKLTALQSSFNSFDVNVDDNFDPESETGKKILAGYLIKMSELQKEINQIRSEIIS